MKLPKTTAIVSLAGAALLLCGCQQSGRFLGNIENCIEKEAKHGPELAWHTRRFFEEQKKTPEAMRKNFYKAYVNNDRQREEMAKQVGGYLQRERDVYPTIDWNGRLESGSEGGKSNQSITFPGQGH